MRGGSLFSFQMGVVLVISRRLPLPRRGTPLAAPLPPCQALTTLRGARGRPSPRHVSCPAAPPHLAFLLMMLLCC